MNGKIYCIRNNINGKMYIGQTTNKIEIRIAQHFSLRFKNMLICRSINKYGRENFSYEILANGIDSREELDIAEDYYIWFYRTMVPFGMNLKTGGTNGSEYSEETKDKISVALKKAWSNPEYKKMYSDRMKALASTKEWKKSRSIISKKRFEKQSERERSAELMRKISSNPDFVKKAIENRVKSGKTCSPIFCIENGRIFDSIKSASHFFNIKKQGISASLRFGNSCSGIHFSYLLEKHNKLVKRTIEEVDANRPKKVMCVETGVVYSSAEEVIRSGVSNVRGVIGKDKKAHGLTWVYLD